ncbi:DUF3324 domain-containing protein [Lactobacillus curvatus]|nr:DUF3324 domain-containing protein [Latilactobacillus curvatus]MSE24207.1 DUF3324 domain-containing protein [Latilactobacillus curvatus]
MKNCIEKWGLSAVIAVACLIVAKTNVQAAVKTQNSDFEIQRLATKSQINEDLKYFDLKIKPGKQETIKMRIQNFSDHKITVKTAIRNSYTQIGGGLNFTKKTNNLDKSLKTPLTKIAQVNKADRVINLGPQEARDVSTTVTMPDDSTSGVIYGDWQFVEYMNKKSTDSAVSSNYAYSVGIALRGSRYKVYPELKYSQIKPMLYENHPAMGIELRNIQPMLLQNVTMQAVVSKAGLFSSKHIFKTTKSKIAPNSKITLPISWAYDALKAGKYDVNVKVSGENDWNHLPMSWTFKKTLTVKKEDAERINQTAIKQPKNKWMYVSVASGALLLVVTSELLKLLLTSGLPK